MQKIVLEEDGSNLKKTFKEKIEEIKDDKSEILPFISFGLFGLGLVIALWGVF